MLRKILLITIVLSAFNTTLASKGFPIQGEMVARVKFWEKVYTQITTKEAFIHDADNVSIIYRKVKIYKNRKKQRRVSNAEKKRIAKIIRSIAKKRYKNLNKKEKALVKIIGKRSTKTLKRMARRIRYQYGLKDRYYAGLIRSYAYIDFIKKTFKKSRLPNELQYLPHVESSFNYRASSKVGAAGIWQFMRSTAKQYKLKVGYVVDERRDPLKATRAAARFLRDNYRSLKSWPLALTAYNQGVGNVRRAVRKVGSKNINTIVEKYNGRNFGFASKNFYATFMATVNISKNPSRYFPKFKKPRRFRFSELKLRKSYTVNQLVKTLNISERVIKKYNPSIRRSAFRSRLYIPRGFVLHIPQVGRKTLAAYKKKLKGVEDTYASAKYDKFHIISKNENLYEIARNYRVSLRTLIDYNSIANPSLIYAGMKIRIPSKKRISKRPKLKKIQKEATLRPVATGRLNTSPKELIVSLESYNLDTIRLSKDFYSIRIEVQETLGHIAEWAGTSMKRIRKDNKLRSRGLRLNQRVILQLSPKELITFKKLRNEYHLSIQEDFFASYNITGDRKYKVKSGETLNQILQRTSLPLWLVRMYQDKKSRTMRIISGKSIKLPEIKPKSV